jgi:hypothetical protein
MEYAKQRMLMRSAKIRYSADPVGNTRIPPDLCTATG